METRAVAVMKEDPPTEADLRDHQEEDLLLWILKNKGKLPLKADVQLMQKELLMNLLLKKRVRLAEKGEKQEVNREETEIPAEGVPKAEAAIAAAVETGE